MTYTTAASNQPKKKRAQPTPRLTQSENTEYLQRQRYHRRHHNHHHQQQHQYTTLWSEITVRKLN